MAQQKTTVVLGASDNPARYSYLAVNRLRSHGHPVIAIGKTPGKVADVEITKEQKAAQGYYNYIVSLNPKRIIFNPGTENDELAVLAQQHGIKTMEACTLVMLSTGQY
jgi:uncharacterized protein